MGPLLHNPGQAEDSARSDAAAEVETDSLLINAQKLRYQSSSVYSSESYITSLKDHSSADITLEEQRVKKQCETEQSQLLLEEQQPKQRALCLHPPKDNGGVSIMNLKLDKMALAFGTRMSVCITVASLFTLIDNPMDHTVYPQAMWITITVLFVCWFPSMDAASVVEKSLQRIYGTLIGASVGLLCGFLSLSFVTTRGLQALVIGICIFIYTFIICWAATQFKVEGTNTKIIAKYNYACILALLTFYICLMPFLLEETGRWEKSLYRVLNVLIGCVLGALLSIFVLPRSTVQILQHKIETQIKLAGEASKAVMHHAADHFSESAYLPVSHADEMLESSSEKDLRSSLLRTKLSMSHRPWRKKRDDVDLGADEALEKHDNAIQESRLIKGQLKLLKYDPFHFGTPDEVLEAFRKEVAHTLARALRIQHTVVLLDGIVRNDPKHDFSEEHIRLFGNVGTMIGRMLSVPMDDSAAVQLQEEMVTIRKYIVDLASVVATSSDSIPDPDANSLGQSHFGSRHNLVGMLDEEDEEDPTIGNFDDYGGKGAPKHVHGSRVCALLFLQLVEHLALRSVRLYQSWKFCEHLCHAAEHRERYQSSVRNLRAFYSRRHFTLGRRS